MTYEVIPEYEALPQSERFAEDASAGMPGRGFSAPNQVTVARVGTGAYPYPASCVRGACAMPDANVRIPAEARNRLADIAAAEGLSLRAYLARLAESLLTPAERAEQAEKARAVLREWNGYAPSRHEQIELDAELDRRMAEVAAE